MSKINFIFGKNNFEMEFENTDTIQNVLEKYTKLLSINKKELFFLYKGKNIILTKNNLSNRINKKNNIIITVIKKINNKNVSSISEGNIFCSECKNLSFLNINENNIIKLDNCANKHKNEYSINEFIKNQDIEEKKDIKCDICSLYNDKFYICTCKKNICQLCQINHIKNKEHTLLYYDKRYSNCNYHLIEYVSFCSLCNVNLCEKCEKEHNTHTNKIIYIKRKN